MQARIKTKFGELVIDFETEDELKKKINSVNIKNVSQIVGSVVEKSKVQIKVLSEFKDLYTVDEKGIRLLKFPKDKRDQIRLVLFLAGIPLNAAEITYATGIKNPKSLTKTKDFEQNSDGTVIINSDGRKEVVEKIIPILRPKVENNV